MDGCLSNFDDAYQKWLGGKTPTHDSFREAVEDYRIFSKLEPMANASKLIDFMNDLVWDHGIRVEILTSINKVNENQKRIAIEDKREWLYQYWDIDESFNAVDRKEEKSRYATPNAILIDDNVLNCMDFKSNYGRSILHVDALVGETIKDFWKMLETPTGK